MIMQHVAMPPNIVFRGFYKEVDMNSYEYAVSKFDIPSLEEALFVCGSSKDEMWELYLAMRAKQDGNESDFNKHLMNLKGYSHV